jgi:DGQHR domain-containing protein
LTKMAPTAKPTHSVAPAKAAVAKKGASISKAGNSFTYEALSYAQRSNENAPRFVLFHAPAQEIASWADVDRLAHDNKTGAQRPLQELKAAKVAKFLRRPENTIPTAVVIALDTKSVDFKASPQSQSSGLLTIKLTMANEKRPGLIIDGQHRVYGALKHPGDVQLNVVAFLGGNDAERAFQFVVINNSAAKVSKDHIRALNLQFDPDALNKRLLESSGATMGVSDSKYADLEVFDKEEPFVGLIQWPTNANGFIAATALESALTETRERAALLGIEGLETDVFLQIWRKIKEIRGAAWNGQSRLLHKASIYALTVFILETMVARLRTTDEAIDFTDVTTLDELVTRVVERIPLEFWTTEWRSKELDTTLGRKLLLDALNVIESNVRFKRNWYDSVSMVDPALLFGQTYAASKKKAVRKSKPND